MEKFLVVLFKLALYYKCVSCINNITIGDMDATCAKTHSSFGYGDFYGSSGRPSSNVAWKVESSRSSGERISDIFFKLIVEKNKEIVFNMKDSLKNTECKNRFYKVVKRYIYKEYKIQNKDKHVKKIIDRTLSCLVSNVVNVKEALIFISHAIFATGGFRNLTSSNKDTEGKYCSRGILQITTEPNYATLDLYMHHITDFHRYPEKLASCDRSAILATILFWRYKVVYKLRAQGKRLTFGNTLKILAPGEYNTNSDITTWNLKLLNNRWAIYKELRKAYYKQTRRRSITMLP